MPKQYEVIEAVNHDNRGYATGDKIELEDHQAQSLLDLGKIKECGGKRESTLPPVIGDSSVTPTPEADLLQTLPERTLRESELRQKFDQEGWKAIQAIAQAHDITKPSSGWDAAIPLILDKEFPPNNEPPVTTP